MLDALLNDIVGIIRATFLGGEWLSLAIAFGAVLLAALVMQRPSQIGTMTVLALVLFILGNFINTAITGGATAPVGSRLASEAQSLWAQFLSLQVRSLLAYFLAFMVLVLGLFSLKALVSR